MVDETQSRLPGSYVAHIGMRAILGKRVLQSLAGPFFNNASVTFAHENADMMKVEYP